MTFGIYHGISYELLDTCTPSWLDQHYGIPCDDSYDHRYLQSEEFEEIDDEDCPF